MTNKIKMNKKTEKFIELLKKANIDYELYLRESHISSLFGLERFAASIIEECISVVQNRDMGSGDSSDIEIRNCISDIKNHFGVNNVDSFSV